MKTKLRERKKLWLQEKSGWKKIGECTFFCSEKKKKLDEKIMCLNVLLKIILMKSIQ